MSETEKLQSEPRTYFGFTPHIDINDPTIVMLLKEGVITTARGTVAICVKEGVVYWGITVCSEGDNFSRSVGRRKAEERLKFGGPGSGSFKVPEKLKELYIDDHDLSLALLDNMLDSVFRNIRKKQRLIGQERIHAEIRAKLAQKQLPNVT